MDPTRLIAESIQVERRQGDRRHISEKVACVWCGHLISRVIAGRPWNPNTDEGYVRYRRCERCEAEFESVESPRNLLKPGKFP